MNINDNLTHIFDFSVTRDLLQRDFVQSALIAAALLALIAGLLGPLIISRQMAFSVHGTSELTLTGAAFALLCGLNIGYGAIAGALVAACLFGVMGLFARERDSVIGVIMAFGLGLAVLFLALYPGRQSTAFSLLTGQIVSVDNRGMTMMVATAIIVVIVLAVTYRPLLFASTDPEVAAARGVPVRTLSIVFAMLLGLAAAQGVQIVGALLVMSLLITPAAAATRISHNPVITTILSLLFAEVAAVGGILLSLAPALPISVFVTTISFVIYIACRIIGRFTAKSR